MEALRSDFLWVTYFNCYCFSGERGNEAFQYLSYIWGRLTTFIYITSF